MKMFDTEYKYTEKNFRFIQDKVRRLAGINLPDTKTALVYSRISRLLRLHHFNTFDEYCAYLNQKDAQVENEFINAITTNFTSFMREKHHFDFLQEVILPQIISSSVIKKMRFWSAGCSTGEEAFSISFVVHDFLKNDPRWDVKILATDIDSNVLNKAKQGIYNQEDILQLPDYYKNRKREYFNLNEPEKGLHEIRNELKRMIYFKKFNLMTNESWPMKGPFDVIFCRNVMIYFDRQSQHHIIKAFINMLGINGYLILGHSESVPGSLQQQLRYVDKTIYRRVQ